MGKKCNYTLAFGLSTKTTVDTVCVRCLSWTDNNFVVIWCKCWDVLAVVYDNHRRNPVSDGVVNLRHSLTTGVNCEAVVVGILDSL